MWQAVKSYSAASTASDESTQKLLKIQASRSKGKNVDKDAKKEMKVGRVVSCLSRYGDPPCFVSWLSASWCPWLSYKEYQK